MISTVNHAAVAVPGVSLGLGRPKSSPPARIPSVASPSNPSSNISLPLRKPLYISNLLNPLAVRPTLRCHAYEANRSEIFDFREDAPAAAEETARKVKIGLYFATWWALNVVFNIYNKKVLNAFPYPWLTSTLSLAAGSLIMFISWATRVVEPPQIDSDFLKALLPVSIV